MKKDIEITVSGIQQDPAGHQTVTDCKTRGQYFERDGCRYLLYEELDTESKAVTHNTLKIKDRSLELIRRGNVSSHMVFALGTPRSTEYITAYGTLHLEVDTEDLNCLWRPADAVIEVKYSLSMSGELLSRNRLIIKIKFICPKD